MRILHVVPTYLPATRYGGPIYAVHGLCKAQVQLGHDVSVLTTSVDGPGDSDVPHETPVSVEGVSVRYFRSPRLRRLYWSPSMQRAFAHEVPRADVVHLHSVYLWPTSAAARVAVRAGIPYVVSTHGALSPEMIAQKSPFVKTAWLQLIERGTLARAARVHFTCTRERDDALRLPLPMPAPRIVPLGTDRPETIDPRRASAEVRAAMERGRYMLFLGRLSWIKGIDRLLAAMASTDVSLIVAGVDDENLRPALERQIDALGLSRQVTFLPAVADNDKWSLLQGASNLVLPSHNENFGLVVVEAMAAGTPVIVTPTVGAADVVRASGAGLVSAPDPDMLRAAMLRLWTDRAQRDELGARGARYVREHLTWRGVGLAMIAVYGEIAQA